MPRATGYRTGKKHKKRKVADPATEECAKHESKMSSLQAAAAAAEAAARVAQGDDGAVQAWLDEVVEQVIKQVSADEAKQEQARRWRAMREATAIACAESYKRRREYSESGHSNHVDEPDCFYDAWKQSLREWEWSYPGDQCRECARHLSLCFCRVPCRKCGQCVLRRAWQVNVLFPELDECLCDKVSRLHRSLMRKVQH